jgi:hypothetical protein
MVHALQGTKAKKKDDVTGVKMEGERKARKG